MKPSYTDSETQAILARALEIDAQSPDGIAAEQLVSIAAELGISPKALEKAIGEHGGHAVAVNEAPKVKTPDKTPVRQILAVVGIVIAIAIGAAFVLRLLFAPTHQVLPPTPPRAAPQMPGKASPPPRIIPAGEAPPPTIKPPGPVPKKQKP